MKGVDTRQYIIEKSAALFNKYGYHQCSMNDIMIATKLQKGGIYNHFQNKDEIMLASFDYNFSFVINKFRKRLDKDTNPVQKIHSVIEVMGNFTTDKNLKNGCPIFKTGMEALNTHSLLQQKAREGLEMLKKYIEIKLSEGVQQCLFRHDTNVSKVAALILMTLEGGIMMTNITKDQQYILQATESMKEYIDKNVLIP
ncbi:MAG: TetR/AcrR family transcriptional regulator [Cyclobacteriaceae bacterium]|nr:TetR/AcrR family transcriptional regulator [Cyclobacteriaceae bacterium]